MKWNRAALLAAMIGVLGMVSGCEDDGTGSGPGSMIVTVETTGDGTDPDGYVIDLNAGDQTFPVGVNETVTLDLAGGTYTTMLTGLAENCEVDGTNARNVHIARGEEDEEEWEVECDD